MARILDIPDLPQLPAEVVEQAQVDPAAGLRLAACWGYQLAASDLSTLTKEDRP